MKLIAAPKGWSQLLMSPPATPWAALRSAISAGSVSTLQTLIDAGLRGKGGVPAQTGGWQEVTPQR